MKELSAHGVIWYATYPCSNTVLGVCKAHELSDGNFLRGRVWRRHSESRRLNVTAPRLHTVRRVVDMCNRCVDQQRANAK